MRTRSSSTPKPAPEKKTPPARKSAGKSTPNSTESATPKSGETRRVAATRGKQVKNVATTPTPNPTTETNTEPAEKESAHTEQVTPKVASSSKPAARKTPARTKSATKAKPVSKRTPRLAENVEAKVESPPKKEEEVDPKDAEFMEEDEHATVENVGKSTEEENTDIAAEGIPCTDVGESVREENTAIDTEGLPITDVGEHVRGENIDTEVEESPFVDSGESEKLEEVVDKMVMKPLEIEGLDAARDLEEEVKEEVKEDEDTKTTEVEEDCKNAPANMEEDTKEEKVGEDVKPEGNENQCKEILQDYVDQTKTIEIKEDCKNAPANMEEDTKEEKDGEDVKPEGNENQRKEILQDYVDRTKTTEIKEECTNAPANMGEERKEEKDGEDVEPEVNENQCKEILQDYVDQTKTTEVKEKCKNVPANMEEDTKEEKVEEDTIPEGNENHGKEILQDYVDQEGPEQPGEEDIIEEHIAEPAEEAKILEEENSELTAITKERKIKREHEIFVGGLDRDAAEEDVRKVFEKIGEVVEVRLHKSSTTNQNKGYAFVKFSNKEHATRALSEMKNPVICGKRCGTAPSEDHNSLFLGNICNTWTKEAIKQKLKDYGVEGVENITLVPDAQNEGLSRGFAFLEFSCHSDAMLAYKRLQKPDVIFGHAERTAKVAFAEPLREPDPEVMAQVKSVFIDALPPQWDEDHVREQFKCYGEITQVTLARSMSTAKRKDFGFVDFTTHEAALACIDGINNTELGDRNSKTKVRARLSNPLPKTQAVKGEIAGGFRIGHAGGGSFSKLGRGIGRSGHHFNQANFQQSRGFYQHGRVQGGRLGFINEYDNPNPEFHPRQAFGRGGRGSVRGSYQASGRGSAVAGPSRPVLDRPWHRTSDRGRGEHIIPPRQQFPPGGGSDRTFYGRQFEDPYLYDDRMHGIKRPFYLTDQDPSYMEPSRIRPRWDYSDPEVPFGGTHYRDTLGAGSDLYPHNYYGFDYGRGGYSSFYAGGRPHGGRYH